MQISRAVAIMSVSGPTHCPRQQSRLPKFGPSSAMIRCQTDGGS
jgi:hypothetical protein